MHDAPLFIGTAIARAHDCCLLRLGRRHQAGKLAKLEERVARLEAESALPRARFLRVPARRRPHDRRHERMDTPLARRSVHPPHGGAQQAGA